MNKHLFLSVAAAALIAGSGLASAQAPAGGAAGGAPAERSAPAGGASERAAPSAAPMNRDSGAAEAPKGAESPKAAQSKDAPMSKDAPKAAQSKDAPMSKDAPKAAQSKDGMDKGGKAADKDMKGERDGTRNADSKDGRAGQTTGQAAAGAKLTTEQRTRVTSVIRQQNIRPETNVNFSISVGTRVPREVRFHPLPAEIITVYPDWRGYEFFLVRDDIIVVNPRTLEIVAVLPA